MIMLCVSVCILIVCLPPCMAYSRGAPRHACRNLEPLHGVPSESSPSPYKLTARLQEYEGSPAVNVSLLWDGESIFKGYLIQARDEDGILLGEFILDSTDSGYLGCSRDFPLSGVTHSDGKPKTGVKFMWKPPNGYKGPIVFKATAVQEQRKFWTGHHVRIESLEPTTTTTITTTTTTPTTTKVKSPEQNIDTAEPETSGYLPMVSSVILLLLCLMC